MRNWLSERFSLVKPRAHSTLFYLVAANLSVAAPLAGMTGVLLMKYAASERAGVINAMNQKAGEIASRVDQELAAQLMAGQWVATSPALEAGDWVRFYDRAQRTLAYYGEAVVVATESGRQIVNTNAPFGAELAVEPPEHIAVSKRALAENGPVYSNVFFGRRARKWLVNMVVPAPCPMPERCVVKISASVDRIRRLLTLDSVPADFLVTVYDREFNVITRTNSVAAAPDAAALRQAVVGSAAGHVVQPRGADPLRIGYARTSRSGWYVAISALESDFSHSVSDDVNGLLLKVLLLFSGAMMLAVLMARNLARSINALARAALDPGARVETYVIEVNAVGDVLRERAQKIEEQRQALEETIKRIHLLMRETLHKAKNQLQVIQAMAKQTALHTSNPRDFVARFSDRLHGLSNTHNMLVNANYTGLNLRELIQNQIPEAYRGRVERIGDEITIMPEPGQNLGMAFHELADNAIKFGALAGAGRVTVSWGLEPATQRFFIEWVEREGPIVTEPLTKGFGSLVIKTLVGQSFGGKVNLSYSPEGLVWRLDGSMDYLKRD